jgi:hypothetical protein
MNSLQEFIYMTSKFATEELEAVSGGGSTEV